MKTTKLSAISLVATFAFTTTALAYYGQSTPMLSVSGKYLRASGQNVRLMGGWMQPTASWFNGQGRWYSDPQIGPIQTTRPGC